MQREFTRLPLDATVGEALDALRSRPPVGRIFYLYVLDEQNRLRGVVPARSLILSSPEKPLADIMIKQVATVPVGATVLEACEFFIQHRLLALPVVDEQGQMLGVIDVELYTDEVSRLESAHVRDDLFQLVGVYAADSRGGPLSEFRRRFPWLGCNLGAGILAAFLSGVFEAELNRVVALAFFIPVVLNLAESVSSQSVSLALHALSVHKPNWRSILGKVRQEFLTGMLLGITNGAIIGLVALIWLRQPGVTLCLLGGIGGGVTGAAMLGIALPVMLRLLQLEPRVAAGPIALAGADVLTILIYLNLARWLLN
jgi:magnesium transporter